MNTLQKWGLRGFWVIVGVVIGIMVMPLSANTRQADIQQAIGNDIMTESDRLFAQVYSNVAPSVVAITAIFQNAEVGFGGATGSGFFIDTQGHIVTNFHVVDGADRIEIRTFDGTIKEARVVGLDPDSDIAVIQAAVPVERIRTSIFANSDQLAVGQTVLAIGNPFENDWTLTSGIISALQRTIVGLNNYSIGGVIQTDAAINPGNSGGPLLNLRGEVIGMNSQINTETGQNSGVGFAVPSNLIVKVARSLIETGEMRYSFLGIRSRPIDLDLIEAFNLPDNIRGVAILQATAGFPAANAGIRTIGTTSVDIITAINGVAVSDFDELVGWLAINTNPGDVVNVTVYRGGQVFNVPITLAARPQ